MCGIAGILRVNGRLTEQDERDLSLMTRALAHRGPDDEGFWSSGNIGLGHRRLAIVDPSPRSSQPMKTVDAKGVLSYNGEVYNYIELRKDLEREGHVFETTGDTEVVLKALHVWGPEKAVPLFNGMFAFAYFDQRTNCLWLARDRLGIKPISILRDGDRVLFASEDKAFLRLPDWSVRIDAHAVSMQMQRLLNSNNSSLLDGVERLAPGTMLALRGDHVREITYWDVLSAFDPKRIVADRSGDDHKAQELENLVSASVALHQATDTDIASCLSGGVDSGLITALAVKHRPAMQAFVVDPYEGPNESSAAEMTAAKVGATLNRVKVSREDLLRLWPEALFAAETFTHSESITGLLALTRKCRSLGIPVLLTGEGADELFGGYTDHRATAAMWSRLDSPWLWFRKNKTRQRLLAGFSYAPFPNSLVLAYSGLPSRVGMLAAPGKAFEQKRIFDAVGSLGRASDRGVVAAGLADLMIGWLPDLLVRHDRLGMASSVETRVPYLENRIIDFAMHLGARHLLRGSTSKPLLKRVAARYIPHENVYKKKLGFPMTSDFSAGTEKLIENGVLRDIMKWRTIDVASLMDYARTDGSFRFRMVGAEISSRIFAGGTAIPELSDMLVGLSAQNG
jgi:asparagine synthase (glutamine-hydrolysing)